MIIRPARLDDAEALAALSGQLGYASVESEIEPRLAAVLDHHDHAVFVSETDDVVTGWIHVFRADRVESDPFAEIGGLVVDESSRGRGIGRSLTDFAAGWARESGLDDLRVRSNVIRDEARSFYLRLGFAETKRQAVFVRAVPH